MRNQTVEKPLESSLELPVVPGGVYGRCRTIAAAENAIFQSKSWQGLAVAGGSLLPSPPACQNVFAKPNPSRMTEKIFMFSGDLHSIPWSAGRESAENGCGRRNRHGQNHPRRFAMRQNPTHPQIRKNPNPLQKKVRILLCMMEHKGVEPLASTMPLWRATNCANAPQRIYISTYAAACQYRFEKKCRFAARKTETLLRDAA